MDRYASVHEKPNGPGDARPTAQQVIEDQELVGKMTGKVALITGGTAGLGTESARVLQMTGMKVYITARSREKGESVVAPINEAASKAGFPSIEVVPMELSSVESVRAGATEFLERAHGQINILITNAGVMCTPYEKTTDGFELQFGVNHLAHFLLLQLLKPSLIASSTEHFRSRVISVSSGGHKVGGIHPDKEYHLQGEDYNPFKAYAQTKTANIYMASECERRLGSHGVHAWSLHPGVIFDTSIGRHQEDSEHWEQRMNAMDPGWGQWTKSIPQGTATQVWAAVAKELEGKGGLYLDDVQVAPAIAEERLTSLPGYMPGYAPWAYDEAMEKRLWDDSCRILGLAE